MRRKQKHGKDFSFIAHVDVNATYWHVNKKTVNRMIPYTRRLLSDDRPAGGNTLEIPQDSFKIPLHQNMYVLIEKTVKPHSLNGISNQKFYNSQISTDSRYTRDLNLELETTATAKDVRPK